MSLCPTVRSGEGEPRSPHPPLIAKLKRRLVLFERTARSGEGVER
jgi:hypothetical protein